MATMRECLDVSLELLRRAGIAPAAWHVLRPALRRAVAARVLHTQDSATIDAVLRMLDACVPVPTRGTGDVEVAGAAGGAMLTLGVIGGVLLGVAATLAIQRGRVAEMEAAEYEARVDALHDHWRDDGYRHATVAEVATGRYGSHPL